jgi:hypothetical protein
VTPSSNVKKPSIKIPDTQSAYKIMRSPGVSNNPKINTYNRSAGGIYSPPQNVSNTSKIDVMAEAHRMNR